MNKYSILPILLTALLATECCCSETVGVSSQALSAVGWGSPTNGLQAGISFHPAVQGQQTNLVLTFHLRNVGKEPIRILKLASQAMFWGDCLPLEVRDGGKVARYQGPVLEPPPQPAEEKYILLKPGDIDTVNVEPVARYWGLQPEVEVEVTFVFRNISFENKGLWTGEARSGTIKVKLGSQQLGP
jgi:hypothetical protein